MPPSPESEPDLAAVLAAFRISADAFLGSGGEARVYALDEARVLRVSHGLVPADGIRQRQALVDELRGGPTPFALPDVLDVGEIAGRTYTVERRMPGRPVSEWLGVLEGHDRRELLRRHLDAAAALGTLPLRPRGWFGELLTDPPLRTATWHDYLVERVRWSLEVGPSEFGGFDAEALAAGVPDGGPPAFVHLDAFAGNMLSDGINVTAVIDIGPACVVGDARLDPLATAVYLLAPQITPHRRPEDAAVVHDWLTVAGIAEYYEAVRRWLAAYWAFAVDDPNLLSWCREVLKT